ncbi:MAG: selenocysteine-specific translation elongation factor [Helicobacteraceae bacterium]|jgi:selenocysteine-specific elongation factor|nr:selenocysteine-specific translation elongation factor [Helicobacteraceae bacterium]
MKRLIVGTAGHIDHGKTALIKALTGFDGDQTKDEKSRGITLDLSFCHLEESDVSISFVDAPGHEKLVKNMIAAAFEFDALLLVVSADDGVMPQTIEHLAIADLLGVKSAIVAVSKSDKVSKERVNEVKRQIGDLFKKCLEIKIAHIIPVSIHQDETIAALKNALLSLEPIARNGGGFFRYYCDRVFVSKGRGVVVTGAVLDGEVKEGDKISACDLNKELSVRAVQTHNKPAQKAISGDRAALNVKGAEPRELYRGVLLAKKGYLRGFNRIGAFVRAACDQELKHDETVQFFIGANRFEARLLLLDRASPNGEFYAEIIAEREIFAVFGDRFVLRNSENTIGGGEVLLPIGDPLNKKQKTLLMSVLKDRKFDEAFAILIKAHGKGFGLISSNQRFALSHENALEIAETLKDVFVDRDALVIYDLSARKALQNIALEIFAKNRRAMLSAQTISDRFKWASKAFVQSALDPLVDSGKLKLENSLYRRVDCDVTDAAEYAKEAIYSQIAAANFSPEAPYNIYDALDLDRFEGDKALKTLTKQGKVTRLSHNLFVASERLSDMMLALRTLIKEAGYADVQNVKARFNLSRKYAVAYLERLDQFGDIRRDDNRRYLA